MSSNAKGVFQSFPVGQRLQLLAVMYVEIDDWYVFVWMTRPIRNGRSFGQRGYGQLAVVLH
jgi:hypothetical protein